MGIEDFIKKVQLAKNSCSEPALLLQVILAEKILDQAERNIRYTRLTLIPNSSNSRHSELKFPITVNSCSDRLHSTKQGPTESVQAFPVQTVSNKAIANYSPQYKAATKEQFHAA